MTQSKPLRPALRALGLALCLCGCASTGTDGYPSLAIRDAERVEGSFPTVPVKRLDVPAVEVDLTGGLDARLAALVAQARSAHAQFTADRPGADRLVSSAGSAATGSDGWAAAQVALADLDSSRSTAAVALGDLDLIYAAAVVQAQDISAIAAARDSVIAMIAEEDEALQRLRSRLR